MSVATAIRVSSRVRGFTYAIRNIVAEARKVEAGGKAVKEGISKDDAAKIKKQLEGADLDNKVLKRQLAIIQSLTPYERRNPKVMNASRKKRVAAGSGTKVEEINRLLAPLDDREREILKLRFGLDRGEPRTLEEVGEHFNLTRERIRQIEARAMSKLRHPSSDTGARDLLAV